MAIHGLVPESLYLCISIFDRFLPQEYVPRKRLQLLAITSLHIACKYEETRQINALEFTYCTDQVYTWQEVFAKELIILDVLDYRLTVPTGYNFLQRFLHITKATDVAVNLASFYMERMQIEYSSLDHKPLHLAAAAVALALNNPDLPGNDSRKCLGYSAVPTMPGVVRATNTSSSLFNYSSLFSVGLSF